ncbi:hypothetical protein V499_00561 [Pseudogymnoascus sp. VKM F-103]|uniref:Amidohydrolase-related domain-containing protein n=1 Tax=Pseudogymnoascus verrucosus TaxID=342668 RepID=A0A1B8GI56_9PEZI|nr:uncharacterized protein VE01_05250 [Pseudogymnoascus verrucosus]KFY80610.1 hypothetical protein V499_00561 [Pseudogymnoascus sp. VKM F-103]OBT95520.1 hypothetical protein VE01_05250 [Pseudogymnoascus verrucosus]
MLGKIALEECWTIPEELENNNPSRFVPAGTGDRLTNELMDIHSHRLRQMDENGVDFMVLSFSSAGCQGLADKATAEAQATLANDRLEAEVMKNPVRFAAFAALSMHDPKQAAEELTRCMTQKKGFVGALLNDFQSAGPDGNTMLFYDMKEYDVFWKAANDLKAPVYLHPRLPTPLIHEQMWKDRPWLNFSALGYADRLNMHALGIITNGVLDRFPDVKILLGHMGEHIPYDLYRIDHKLDRERFPDLPMARDKLVRDYFGSQVFITTSGHFSTPALLCAMAEIGVRSVMFSIDYPFESIPNGCAWFDEHVQATINQHDLVDIGRNNALKVLPKLMEAPHNLKPMTPSEAQVGGLRDGKVTYGMYNEHWSKRLVKMEPAN